MLNCMKNVLTFRDTLKRLQHHGYQVIGIGCRYYLQKRGIWAQACILSKSEVISMALEVDLYA